MDELGEPDVILHPLTSYLTRFEDARDIFSLEQEPADANSDFVPALGDATPASPVDETSENPVLEEMQRALRSEYDARLEEERAAFAAHLIAERRQWAAEEGNRLGEQFNLALDRGIEGVRSSIENILEPFVARGILESLLADFMATLRTVLADRDSPPIQLSGPRDLLDILRARLARENVTVSYAEIDRIDVEAKIGSTVIETCMGEWIRKLRNGD
jgi:hypothetical protein